MIQAAYMLVYFQHDRHCSKLLCTLFDWAPQYPCGVGNSTIAIYRCENWVLDVRNLGHSRQPEDSLVCGMAWNWPLISIPPLWWLWFAWYCFPRCSQAALFQHLPGKSWLLDLCGKILSAYLPLGLLVEFMHHVLLSTVIWFNDACFNLHRNDPPLPPTQILPVLLVVLLVGWLSANRHCCLRICL